VNTHQGTHTPDLEDLAAYLDGRLDAERRRQVEERLARDEGYYEVFMETSRFREEEGLAGAAPPQRRRLPWLPLLAAAAVVLVAVGVWRLSLPADPTIWLEKIDAEAVVAMEDWDDPGWSRVRSASPFISGSGAEERTFRLGVRSIDLRLALAAGDRLEAEKASVRMGYMVEELDLLPASFYTSLAENLNDEETDLAVLKAQVLELEGALEESLSMSPTEARGFAVGQWLQTTRAAALAGDREILGKLIARAPTPGEYPEAEAGLAALNQAADDPSKALEALETLAEFFGG